jgi:hypothetical protein
MANHAPGPWFVSGVRIKMDRGEWHGVNRYDGAKKQDQNICCVGFDPRTGEGFADARLIAAAPEMFEALRAIAEGCSFPEDDVQRACRDRAREAIAKAEGK